MILTPQRQIKPRLLWSPYQGQTILLSRIMVLGLLDGLVVLSQDLKHVAFLDTGTTVGWLIPDGFDVNHVEMLFDQVKGHFQDILDGKAMPDPDIVRTNAEFIMGATPQTVKKALPKNNDGLTECAACGTKTVSRGGGAYQLCDNSSCAMYGR